MIKNALIILIIVFIVSPYSHSKERLRHGQYVQLLRVLTPEENAELSRALGATHEWDRLVIKFAKRHGILEMSEAEIQRSSQKEIRKVIRGLDESFGKGSGEQIWNGINSRIANLLGNGPDNRADKSKPDSLSQIIDDYLNYKHKNPKICRSNSRNWKSPDSRELSDSEFRELQRKLSYQEKRKLDKLFSGPEEDQDFAENLCYQMAKKHRIIRTQQRVQARTFHGASKGYRSPDEYSAGHNRLMASLQNLLDDPDMRSEFKSKLRALMPALNAEYRQNMRTLTGERGSEVERKKDKEIIESALKGKRVKLRLEHEEYMKLMEKLSSSEMDELIRIKTQEGMQAFLDAQFHLAVKKGIVSSPKNIERQISKNPNKISNLILSDEELETLMDNLSDSQRKQISSLENGNPEDIAKANELKIKWAFEKGIISSEK